MGHPAPSRAVSDYPCSLVCHTCVLAGQAGHAGQAMHCAASSANGHPANCSGAGGGTQEATILLHMCQQLLASF